MPEAKVAQKKNWPADKVKRRDVASLVPHARNARTHSARQVAQLAASIREWGWTVPVLVDEDGGIIAGHGRVLAAQKLGIKQVPVMVATGWSDAQKRAYVIADNKLALNAGWDNNLLSLELGELRGLDFDLDTIGLSLGEIASVTGHVAGGSVVIDESYSILVSCNDEAHQAELLKRLADEGLECRALIS